MAPTARSRKNSALVHFNQCSELRITGLRDCGTPAVPAFSGSMRCRAPVSGNTIVNSADVAIYSLDARGLTISATPCAARATAASWCTARSRATTARSCLDNRVEDIRNVSGRLGPVRQRHQRVPRRQRHRARQPHRARHLLGGAGQRRLNIQIANNIATDVGEVAIYSEFGFEGAAIANNTIDGAAIGIAVVNFNEGGRLATVQGNLIRNLTNKRPAGTDPNDGAGTASRSRPTRPSAAT